MLVKLFSIIILFIGLSTSAQQYTEYITSDSLIVSTKWKEGKKGKPSVLMIKVENTSSSDIQYTLGVDFYYNGKTIESSSENIYCIKAGRIQQGKLNGIYFQSSKLSNEQLKEEAFDFELMGLDVESISNCPD